MKNVKEMSPVEKEIRIQHSTTNIKRSSELMKRAVNALLFASRSLEGTEMTLMIEDVNSSKRSLADAIRRLSKYGEEEKTK